MVRQMEGQTDKWRDEQTDRKIPLADRQMDGQTF
jgi:hypothetical protein